MTEEFVTISVRLPADLREKLLELARVEAERTGLRVDLSSVVRRALTEAVADLGKDGAA